MEKGLTLTHQPPLSPVAELHAEKTAHQLWRDLVHSEGFRESFVAAVGDLIGDLPHIKREERLKECGVTALGGVYAGMLPSLAHADDQYFNVLRATAQFGAPTPSVAGWRLPLKELTDGPLAVLRASERTPTVAVRIDDSFENELHATEQRPDVLWLLGELARAVDLRVVASCRWQRKLAHRYRESLPAVSEECHSGPPVGTTQRRVERARDALNPDGRKVCILRQLAAETSETLSYSELYALHQTTKGAVRQCLTNSEPSLVDLDLVETFSLPGRNGSAVELLVAGRELLDVIDSEIGRQQDFETVVSESGKRSDNSRVTPHAHEGPPRPSAEAEGAAGEADGGDRDRHRLPKYHQVRGAARHRYAAAVGCAPEGGIGVVNHPIGRKDDRGEPHWFYDQRADRLLVGAEYDNPMQWWTCIALALTNRRTFDRAVTPERFESGKLGDLLADHVDLLRNSRCLGYLADADATPEGYREALLDAAEDLRELTRRWSRGDYDDRDSFRGDILKEAHGLAGTVVHLLDLADVELVREARIPRYSQDFKPKQKTDLAETLAIGAAIQSRYGEFAAYRQLVESREEKRRSMISPTVNADDPYGGLIGSFVLSGPSVTDITDRLRRRLSNREIHEDAPELAIRIPVESVDGRQHTARTVQTMCRFKSLSPTRAAVSILAGLTGTPYDAARALHNLGPETKAPRRDIRLDEVRYALSTLDAGRLLPEMSKPALSKIVHALLCVETPLDLSALADRANVSARSVRTHIDRLSTFMFVRETDAGWRFALPFHTTDERDESILPSYMEREGTLGTLTRDIFAEVVYDLLDGDRYADPDDPIGGALFKPPGERLPALRAALEWVDPWITTVRHLLDDEIPATERARKLVALVGHEPDQTSLAAATGGD